MTERTVDRPTFVLITEGRMPEVNAQCGPLGSPLPGPCPPNTGFCGPRVMCRPQTEGCFPNQPCVPNVGEPRRQPGGPIPPYPRPPIDR